MSSLINVTDVKDLVNRAFHTFYQTFLVVFAGGLINVLSGFEKGISTGKAAALALLLSALAAGISAVKTALVQTKSK